MLHGAIVHTIGRSFTIMGNAPATQKSHLTEMDGPARLYGGKRPMRVILSSAMRHSVMVHLRMIER